MNLSLLWLFSRWLLLIAHLHQYARIDIKPRQSTSICARRVAHGHRLGQPLRRGPVARYTGPVGSAVSLPTASGANGGPIRIRPHGPHAGRPRFIQSAPLARAAPRALRSAAPSPAPISPTHSRPGADRVEAFAGGHVWRAWQTRAPDPRCRHRSHRQNWRIGPRRPVGVADARKRFSRSQGGGRRPVIAKLSDLARITRVGFDIGVVDVA